MREELVKPYCAIDDDPENKDHWPGNDFTRQLIAPGTSDEWPDGAIGIYIDGNFWAVAALPWSWLDRPLPEVVKSLWPSKFTDAEFCDDYVEGAGS